MSLPFDEKKGCPPGFHKRSSYTSKRGHHVSRRCVRTDTRHNYSRRVLQRQKERFEDRGKSRTSKLHCGPGKIIRHGYVRRFGSTIMRKGYTVKKASGKEYHVNPGKRSVYVKPACIKDKSDPGPGKGIGPLRKGELKKHGYSFRANSATRHSALRKAVAEYGALGVFHKLGAVRELTKRTLPGASQVYEADEKWVRRSFPFATNTK